jgi:uncharacterized Fe-S radical SAM superfamily protein PflX
MEKGAAEEIVEVLEKINENIPNISDYDDKNVVEVLQHIRDVISEKRGYDDGELVATLKEIKDTVTLIEEGTLLSLIDDIKLANQDFIDIFKESMSQMTEQLKRIADAKSNKRIKHE